MPKPIQGIATAERSKSIDISDFIRKKVFDKNIITSYCIYWGKELNQDSDCMNIDVIVTSDEKYMRLRYVVNPESEVDRKEMDYRVYFDSMKSNLGKGDVYYFVCPVSNQRCRILYMAYGSEYFKSRLSYRNRIYYNCQASSKRLYATNRYFKLTDKFDKFKETNFRLLYNGKKTRSFMKIEKMAKDINYFDKERNVNMFDSIMRMKIMKDF